ncbi:NAD-dependent epimerase/dehydratase family protein [Paenibacillus pinisoli]|uniref:NAD-dependent epimerase/dehydratase family protein n=1 Tax=Paenibacillus pinisoli TaxID=1276110 RepID=A0A3A6PPW6_9BACL|nr:NAD(P)H-binding protein [Paenibacillus pinisoli]RJX37973.1 NAD-dependent epimerase/dehydratase family protein [Paenibacillus pinisoli]
MTILVTGATGNVGRHVVDQLVRSGARVRALTRNPATANLPQSVEVVYGELTDPQSLVPALEGVTAMHLITFNGADSAPLQTGAEIIALAEKAGVRKVTLLWSGERGPVEAAAEESGLEWTHLQPPVEFMSNAREWAESIRSEGVIRGLNREVLSAMIHEADIGSVAATVLMEDGHAFKSYTLTGPEVLSVSDKLRHISAEIGRELEFIELTEAEERAKMRQAGIQEDVIDYVVGWHANPPKESYQVWPTVEQITGRPARTFAQWVAENREKFI